MAIWENWIGRAITKLRPVLIHQKPDIESALVQDAGKPVGLLPGQSFLYVRSEKPQNGFVRIAFAIAEKSYAGWAQESLIAPLKFITSDDKKLKAPGKFSAYLRPLALSREKWIFNFEEQKNTYEEMVTTVNAGASIRSGYPSTYMTADSGWTDMETGESSELVPKVETIRYFLDTRNCVEEKRIFQLLDYASTAGQPQAVLQSTAKQILAKSCFYGKNIMTLKPQVEPLNTPTGGGIQVIEKTPSNISEMKFEDAVLKIAADLKINPVFFAAALIVAAGENGSDRTSGYWVAPNGKIFKNLFNFWSSAAENEQSESKKTITALEFAQAQNWNTPYVSILEGAKLLFGDAARTESTLYQRVFLKKTKCRDVSFPLDFSKKIHDVLKDNALLDAAWAFKIPTYKDYETLLPNFLPDFYTGDAFGRRLGKVTADSFRVSKIDYEAVKPFVEDFNNSLCAKEVIDLQLMDTDKDGVCDAFDLAEMERLVNRTVEEEQEGGTEHQEKPKPGEGIEILDHWEPDRDAYLVWSTPSPYQAMMLPLFEDEEPAPPRLQSWALPPAEDEGNQAEGWTAEEPAEDGWHSI